MKHKTDKNIKAWRKPLGIHISNGFNGVKYWSFLGGATRTSYFQDGSFILARRL